MRRFRHCPLLTLGCPRGGVVEAPLATRFGARLLGLARLPLRPARGLVIPRCACVQTLGMREPLDVVFLTDPSPHAVVIEVHPAVPRRRVVRCRTRGRGVAALELAAGEAERLGLRPGALVLELERRDV